MIPRDPRKQSIKPPVIAPPFQTVLVENGKAVGVQLRNGGTVRARKAVVSNASSWDTLKLLPEGSVPAEWRQERAGTPECGSFMHLHLGIDKKVGLCKRHFVLGDLIS